MPKLKPAPHKERGVKKIGITPTSPTTKGAFFRLTSDDISRLNEIKSKLSEHSKARISQAKVIQALIQIGIRLEPRKILKALGETMYI